MVNLYIKMNRAIQSTELTKCLKRWLKDMRQLLSDNAVTFQLTESMARFYLVVDNNEKWSIINILTGWYTESTFRYSGGFLKTPTPGGVPVRITSPGLKVINLPSVN